MTQTVSCSSYRTSGLEDVWMSLVFVLKISWLFCHQSEPVSQCGAAAGGLHVPVYSSPRSGGVCDPHVSPDRDRHHAQSPAAGTHTLPHTVHKHTHVYLLMRRLCVCGRPVRLRVSCWIWPVSWSCCRETDPAHSYERRTRRPIRRSWWVWCPAPHPDPIECNSWVTEIKIPLIFSIEGPLINH